MDEFVAFTQRSIPLAVLLPSVAVMCGTIVCIMAMHIRNWKRWVLGTLLAEYSFLVLWSTVFRRAGRELARYELMPYWNMGDILAGKDPLDLAEIGLNILLFVPIGMLLAGICSHYKIWKIALIGCAMSFVIELLQLYLKCGLCETNDIIHNTIGTAVGAWILRGVIKWND